MSLRQIVLDTETTGLYANQGDRLIEFAGLEMIDRRLTGKYLHVYVHPERDIAPEAIAVHGITLDDLADKPKFAQEAQRIADFLKDSQLIIHNAAFDLSFLDMEFGRLGMPSTEQVTGHKSIDTVAMARGLYPGQKVNLDALCNRLGVDKSKRVLHGALIDCELLAEVYLGMTRGQFTLDVKADDGQDAHQMLKMFERPEGMAFKVIAADDDETAAHQSYVSVLDKSVGGESLYRQQMQDSSI